MKRKRMAAGEALATALVLPLAGCASGGRVQLSMQKMCQSHGGVWDLPVRGSAVGPESWPPRLGAMPQVTTCLTCQPVTEDMARRVVAR